MGKVLVEKRERERRHEIRIQAIQWIRASRERSQLERNPGISQAIYNYTAQDDA